MGRNLTFKFRLNQIEKFLLFALAEELHRTQGDTLRLLIRSAAQDLKLERSQDTKIYSEGKEVSSAN